MWRSVCVEVSSAGPFTVSLCTNCADSTRSVSLYTKLYTHVSLQYITCCVIVLHYAGAAKHAPGASTSKAAADTTATITVAAASSSQRSISDDVMVTVTEVEGGCGGMDRTVLQRYAHTTLIQLSTYTYCSQCFRSSKGMLQCHRLEYFSSPKFQSQQ
jgi:hypothetical protein